MSLYTRLTNPLPTGGGTFIDEEGNTIELPERKIPVHAFTGLLSEFERGYVTGAQIKAALNLADDEVTAAIAIKDLISQANNKTAMLRIFKDCIYLAEGGYAYTTQEELVTRLNAALADGV